MFRRGGRMTIEMVNHVSLGLNGDGLYFELIHDIDNDVTVLEIGNQGFCIDIEVDSEYYNVDDFENDLNKLLKQVQNLK